MFTATLPDGSLLVMNQNEDDVLLGLSCEPYHYDFWLNELRGMSEQVRVTDISGRKILKCNVKNDRVEEMFKEII